MEKRRDPNSVFDNQKVVGAAVILVAIVAVLISFSASTGLPFVPRYRVTVEIRDAGRITVGAPVRVGGARVGVVKDVKAVPGRTGGGPTALITMEVEEKLRPLPIDSTVRLRPISVLGGRVVAITLGRSKQKLPDGQPLPLSQSIQTVDIDQALRIFSPATTRALQRTLLATGTSFIGRGPSLNQAINHLNRALPPLGRIAATLSREDTRLPRLIDASARVASTLAPLADELHGIVRHAGPTLEAMRGTDGALDDLLRETPKTAAVVTPALRELRPILEDAAVVTERLRRGTRGLRLTSEAFDRALRAAPTGLRLTPAAARGLSELFTSLGRLGRDPATGDALRVVTELMGSARPLLSEVTRAQESCNTFTLLSRNLSSARSSGDANGAFPRTTLTASPAQTLQTAAPEPDLHYNAYGAATDQECETGNEGYAEGMTVGSTAEREPARTESTPPFAEARERAARAGLLDPDTEGP